MRSAESESMAGYDITSFVEFGSASVFRKRIRFLCVDDLPALQIGAEKETSVNRYGHEIEMYTVEQGEKRDKRQ